MKIKSWEIVRSRLVILSSVIKNFCYVCSRPLKEMNRSLGKTVTVRKKEKKQKAYV